MALADWLYPEPAEVFEDRLAVKLGIHRHPDVSQRDWRRIRVAAIEACDQELADAAALEVEQELEAEERAREGGDGA